jgi:hypothetical protein
MQRDQLTHFTMHPRLWRGVVKNDTL